MPVHITELHSWNLAPDEAIAVQRELAAQIITDQPLDLPNLKLVGGVDVSVKEHVSQAAVVVLRYPELDVVEVARATQPTTFPYIPGLLSFREGAVILDAMRKLQATPDVFIFDGMGTSHPRRIGIACHIGLFIDIPTVGCGKSRLVGSHDMLPETKGAWRELKHRGETIGVVLRTRNNVSPVYVSVGNRATLDTSRELVIRCTTRYRLPEPTRAAHNAAGQGGPQDSDGPSGQLTLF
ncbi:MAG TPA: deoxyribonuclease V [Aggregatilineaceae bacterium]|nr:deoxyribonuclease V [Aggregatilineaceae bacterium]